MLTCLLLFYPEALSLRADISPEVAARARLRGETATAATAAVAAATIGETSKIDVTIIVTITRGPV